jgi:hypothetical protein
VWAVDQEPEMVEVTKAKAGAAGAGHIRPVAASAEGRYEFPVSHEWTVAALAGYVRSTSPLPPSVLGDRGADFDADLAASVGRYARDGRLTETVSFAYELARKPTRRRGARAEPTGPRRPSFYRL